MENTTQEMQTGGREKSGKALPFIIIGVSMIICCVILTAGLVRVKKGFDNTISATGSASMDFSSDLVVWRGSFSEHASTSKSAYAAIKKDAELVRSYLLDNGVEKSEIVFSSVSIYESYVDRYDNDGNYVGRYQDGYDLQQNVVITSEDIDTVEKISRDISSLLSSGVEFTSESPEYYCTKLDEVKLELIQLATENARERIRIIADGTGSSLGKLQGSSLGVFQITAQNSGTSWYSYDGYLDTSSREKTASITVNLRYALK